MYMTMDQFQIAQKTSKLTILRASLWPEVFTSTSQLTTTIFTWMQVLIVIIFP